MKRNQLLGSLLLTFVAVIWGTAFVFQRVGMDRIEPLTFTASRMIPAAAIVSLTAFFRRKSMPSADASEAKAYKRNALLGGVLCGAFLAAASIFQQMGIVYTTAGKAGFITALYILLVPIIQAVFFRRRGTWLVWCAVALGVAGMYLLCMTERFSLARGDALICVCALLFSGHILCCDHFAKKADPVRVSAIQFAAAACISWAAAFLLETPSIDKIVSAIVPILYCGVVSGGIGYTLQLVAQKYTDPTVASLLMSLESVFAVLAGTVILHEQMRPREWIGCVVMFAAIILVQVPMKKVEN